MTDIRKVGPLIELQSTSNEMAPEQRCAISVHNIELLLYHEWASNLLLGAELSRMKYSGDFTRDTVWNKDVKGRAWAFWLKAREFKLNGSDTAMSHASANALIMWSVLYGCFAKENDRRKECLQLPLPLPTNVTQLRPYAPLMQRVSDWQRPELNQPRAHSASLELEPPYSAAQPDVIAAWEAAWETIPPDKRIRKGEPVPPTTAVSEQYFRERDGLKQLKAREDREIEEAKQGSITINERPSSSDSQRAAVQKPKKASALPKKSEAELQAERCAFQLQQDARDYRLKLMNLQQSADSLRAFFINTLSREGTEAYLTQLRELDLGMYSVAKDIGLLRGVVTTLQEVYKLATETYVPPTPISRHEVDPTTTTIEL